MLRAILVSLVGVAVAVQLSHHPGKDAAVAEGADFAGTMLLQIESRLASTTDEGSIGDTRDALQSALDKIGGRIQAAQAADDTQQAQRKENCTIDINEFNRLIGEKRKEITATKIEINRNEAKYANLSTLAVTLEGEIATLNASVRASMASIEAAREVRRVEHNTFVNRTTDTTSVIAAIEEFQGVESGSTLRDEFPDADTEHTGAMDAKNAEIDALGRHADEHKGEEDVHDAAHLAVTGDHKANTDTKDVERTDRYEEWKNNTHTAFLQLNALAEKVTDPETKSYLQIAAKAATALGTEGTPYENLQKLLLELLHELRNYTEGLIRDEKQAASDQARVERDQTEDLRTTQSSKHEKQETLEETYRQKRETAEMIQSLRRDLDVMVKELADLRAALKDREEECALFEAQHLERKGRREEETSTLADIQRFLETQINEALSRSARVANSARTTEFTKPTRR